MTRPACVVRVVIIGYTSKDLVPGAFDHDLRAATPLQMR